jgi:hypothetical protein
MTVCGAYVDEVTLVPQVFFEQLYGRMSVQGRPAVLHHQPGQPGALVHAGLAVPGGRKPICRFSFTIDDNPFLDEDYVRRHEGLPRGPVLPPVHPRRMGGGRGRDLRLVGPGPAHRHRPAVRRHPQVDQPRCRLRHVEPVPRRAARPRPDRKLYAAAEWRYEARQTRKQLTDTEYSQRLRGWLLDVPHIGAVRPQFITVDPSAASFVTQLKRDKLTPTPAKNDVMDGIRTVSSLLAANKLLVHASCKALITEIGGYSWDDQAALRGDEQPAEGCRPWRRRPPLRDLHHPCSVAAAARPRRLTPTPSKETVMPLPPSGNTPGPRPSWRSRTPTWTCGGPGIPGTPRISPQVYGGPSYAAEPSGPRVLRRRQAAHRRRHCGRAAHVLGAGR